MSHTDVRLDTSVDLPVERDALIGSAGRPERRQRGERLMVAKAEFRSYYGQPVLKAPPWEAADIAGYLFFGGLAGASSTLAAAAELTGRPHLARGLKAGAAVALTGSLYSLVHDLGRPERFLHMLRVVKVTSPMNIGSWLLAGYGPLAMLAAGSAVTGWLPRLGRLGTLGAGVLGPAVASYTATLVSDTAMPVWHEAYRELPVLFVGSAAASAGALGLLVAPESEAGPARRAALLGAVTELATASRMERRLGMVAEPLRQGLGGALLRTSRLLVAGGALALTIPVRSRVATRVGAAAMLAGSICLRFGIFQAGLASARDPKYTVTPQRKRLEARTGRRRRRP
ncbi:NrfD/PsrC family molybdoenzyme membrane anchor subunit [Plantactinospora soyae]|uniref:Formate-dependent nitrite reductase membrane component NrfD n=1 Tax=Plantactinospora soyae TaxID=1544732 RepID=A0A927QXJ2_9ACTN|nr:NrfD/PsrC family molybdoenzyme membrane anchor subunit [Plantactinospora soyae]MBE1488115.1 formate-dependent nitrite reductase membrane component NrfD [Plantactinospora soyae]